MSRSYRWMREHGALHIPDVRAQNDFPDDRFRRQLRTFLFVPLRQKGELIGILIARRIEVRPFTPAADQTPRDLRRSGCDRHRERAAVPRAQGIVGATDGDERNLRRHCQLADGYSAGTGCRR